jgi:UDP-glucose 4-epimerase
MIPITEEVRKNHGTPYALQKLIGEQYVCLYASLYGLPALSLRYANAYGTRRQSERGSYPNVLAAFSRQKKELGKLLVTGDGEQTRDFIHVFDVVDANLKAALSEIADGTALNVSSGRQTSINSMAGFFDCPIEYVEPRPGEARHLVLDPAKAKDRLKWSCKLSLEEGMKVYLAS